MICCQNKIYAHICQYYLIKNSYKTIIKYIFICHKGFKKMLITGNIDMMNHCSDP